MQTRHILEKMKIDKGRNKSYLAVLWLMSVDLLRHPGDKSRGKNLITQGGQEVVNTYAGESNVKFPGAE